MKNINEIKIVSNRLKLLLRVSVDLMRKNDDVYQCMVMK